MTPTTAVAQVEQPDTTASVSIIEQVTALAITDAASYERVARLRKELSGFEKDIEAYYEPRKRQAKAVHTQYCDDERTHLTPLRTAKAVADRKLTAWDDEQERLRLAEQRRLEEIARQAEEARRLEEAALKMEEGRVFGDDALVVEAEADLHELVTQPIAVAVAPVPKAVPKVQGHHFTTTYSGEVVDFRRLVSFIAMHPQYLSLLQVNAVALNQQAKSLKEQLERTIPGVRAVATKRVAS